ADPFAVNEEFEIGVHDDLTVPWTKITGAMGAFPLLLSLGQGNKLVLSARSPPPTRAIFSERVAVGFAGANAQGVVDRGDEYLTVANLASLGGAADRLDNLVNVLFGDGDLDADFWQEVHRIFGAAIDFGMALLAPITLHFSNRHSVNANREKGVAHFVELERLDDGGDQFHGITFLALLSRYYFLGASRLP